MDVESEVEHSIPIIERILEELLVKLHALKFYLVYNVRMKKVIEESPIIIGFYSKTRTLYTDDYILDALNECKNKIASSVDAFNRKGLLLSYMCLTNLYL